MVDRRSTVVALCVLFLLFRSSFEQLVAPERPSRVEWLALLQLRSSLGLRSREWPLKSNPCLSWAGVQCRNGSIVEINISGFRRTRVGSENPQFAVDSLADFTLLESFNASNFELPGPIPDWFGQRLTALQLLDLRSCSIFGSIPYSIGNMTSLTVLYLSGNSLTGIIPSTLGQLVHLSVLDLSQNSLTGSIPSSFDSLENLTLLDMSFNFLAETIPPAIGNLSKLQSLNLSNNSLSSSIPAQLGNLSSLVDLDLSFNSLSGSIPPDLRGLRNLQRMVIGENLLSGSLPGNLFSPLSQLQLIVMNHNHFTGNLPDTLWSMPRLLLLDVSGNNFTGNLPNLSLNPNTTTAPVFNLSDNLFYGGLTTIIGRLGFIDLSGNYFQGKVLDYDSRNASLTENCLQNVPNQRNLAECSSFYADRSLTFDNFGLPQAPGPLPPKSGKKKRKTILILAGVLGGVGFIAFLVIVVVLILRCPRQRIVMNQRGTSVGPTIPTGGPPPPPGPAFNFTILGEVFTYQQILQATSDFNDSNLIKHGHSGDLFRAVLEGGVPIVIKRINLGSVKKESYMLELDIFSKVSHPRLVPLLGHCLENENEKFLIYKYMPNGDLSSSLFKKTNLVDDSIQSLDWITRLKIAIGAAEGLSYLHHECNPPLVHRDVQASSILLDDKFEVRLGSLSEVCAQEGDVHQSRITRLLRFPQSSEQGASGTPTSTCAYDVYCFGKVLLELVTGKLGISASSDSTLKDMLEQTLPYISIYDKELVTNIVDPTLIIDEDLLEEVWAMAVVARSCLNPKPSRRPLMKYILKALENPLKVVRDENISSSTNSARLRTTSSRGSWNATAVFGSWRHSSSDVAVGPTNGGGGGSFKQIGTTGSQGSGVNGGVADHSSSNRRQSNEIFPEPLDVDDGDRERRG